MITVTPQTFTKVDFDAARLAELCAEAIARVPGLPTEMDLEVRIDEDAATSRMAVASLDPLVLALDSGAVEDYKRPRELGELAAAITFTRLLLEVVDRTDPSFGAPGLDEELTQAHAQAWDVNLYARVGRLGLRLHQPRFRYNFRNRHGFTDAADRVFDQLWAEDLTWDRITELSDRAVASVGT